MPAGRIRGQHANRQQTTTVRLCRVRAGLGHIGAGVVVVASCETCRGCDLLSLKAMISVGHTELIA